MERNNKLALVLVFVIFFVAFAIIGCPKKASAQEVVITAKTLQMEAKTAERIVELKNELAILQATLPVVNAVGDIKVAEATTERDVDRLKHEGSEARKDAKARREAQLDPCRPRWNVLATPSYCYGYGYGVGYGNYGGYVQSYRQPYGGHSGVGGTGYPQPRRRR